MLKSLEIRNFVLIDKLKINLDSGFNVLTGETGAGKSIIISALELITGEKGSTRAVGVNADKLLVIGIFELTKSFNLIKEKLSRWGIELNSRELIIKREISKDGKSKSFINSSGVRVAELKEIGDLLVDIHGQHEHQSLFNHQHHISFYDSYLRIDQTLLEYRKSFKHLTKLENQYNEIIENKNTIEKEKSFLTFCVEEIENANIKINEDEEIKNDIDIMGNAEKIDSSLNSITKDIFGNENGAYTKLLRSISALQTIAIYDSRLENMGSEVEGITLSLEDIKTVLMDIRQKTQFDPQKLQSLNERLFFINSLKKKYGQSIKDIIEYAKNARIKLDTLNFSDEDIENLKVEIEDSRKSASDLAFKLSEIRKSQKDEFVQKIETEMNYLGMTATKFDVEITKEEDESGILIIDGQKYKANNNGIDSLEFIIAPNKQAMFLPLRKIASGGEISRIMLSLKSVLSMGDFSESIVFDEIDVGVGGRIAESIGEKIALLSKDKQVLTVTHLAQIAVHAQTHFKVIKDEGESIVTSHITEVVNGERVQEIARMIAGKEITDLSIKHASQMLENAR